MPKPERIPYKPDAADKWISAHGGNKREMLRED